MSGDAEKLSTLATQKLPLLRSLPVPLAAIMMQQVVRAGRLFPVEVRELEATLQALTVPRSPAMEEAVHSFATLQLSAELQRLDWTADPAGFVEKMTAELWSSGQIGAFRDAAKLLVPATAQAKASLPAKTPRFAVIVLDRRLSAASNTPVLFRKLRPHGTFFPNVKDEGAATLGEWISARAAATPELYAHWCLSGGADQPASSAVISLSYDGLKQARQQLLARFNTARNTAPASGPEGLRRTLLYLTPEQVGLASMPDPILRAFAMEIFTGGSGTQLYSTTFVQWTVREVLRRAQPRTLLARFTPRSEATSIDLRITHPEVEPPLDGRGSLIDAEMGAHLSYLNLRRLSDAENASFLVWHEGYGQALLIGNGMPGGAESQSPTTLKALLRLTT